MREIEAAAASPVINIIPEVHGDIQPVHTAEKREEERTETEAKVSPKKARSKKKTKKV